MMVDETTFVEKQVTTPEGGVINYGESPDEGGDPLLLIPGQWVFWQDYLPVAERLAGAYHVFVVDVYGHGGSSMDPELYPVNANGRDLAWLIDNIIGAPAVVSGHSSGALIGAWMASRHPDSVRGLVLEDPPFFSISPERRGETAAWKQHVSVIHDFLQQSEETNYTKFWLDHTYLRQLWGASAWDNAVKRGALTAMERHPGQMPKLTSLAAMANKPLLATRNTHDGTGPYDLQYAEVIDTDVWFQDWDDAEIIASITCPTILMHAAASYNKDNVLMGAMDDDDVKRFRELLPAATVIDGIAGGHEIHENNPDLYVDTLLDFRYQLI
ncbi:MAG: alpha/beta hydrolase [Propionibacteriaceae bacterium]|jgi:pimeloyl-ACP methyl ester carboxylesterase|nr:alpha/beta hydrolase [Propionibacteriaceae bacterium]